MYRSQHPESESNDIFQASEFVELDIPHASKHQITVGIDRKELITVRAGGIEIDIPITTEETTLFKILQRLALLHMMFDFSNVRIFLRPGTTDMRTSKDNSIVKYEGKSDDENIFIIILYNTETEEIQYTQVFFTKANIRI